MTDSRKEPTEEREEPVDPAIFDRPDVQAKIARALKATAPTEPTEEELARDLRATGKRLMELPGERPYQLVLSSVETAIVGHDLILAADRIETLRQENERLREALDRYGEHDLLCPAYDTAHMPETQRECDCGLRQLLQGTP